MRRVIVVGALLAACGVIAAGAAWWTRRAEPPGPVAASRAGERVAEAADTPGEVATDTAAPGAAPGADRAPGAAPAAPAADTDPADTDRDGPAAATARALPWLHHFAAVAVSGEASAQVVERMARWRAPDLDCSAAAYGGLAISADVAAAPGREEVLASYTQGVLVLDAAGRVIASAPAPGCQGSADDLEAIAVGDAQLDARSAGGVDAPVIALAATGGGHRASSTWLGLYRVAGGAVAPIFTGVVEDRVGDRVRTGEVTLLPGALLYRAPSGEQTLWLYRPEQRRYVQQALVLPPSA